MIANSIHWSEKYNQLTVAIYLYLNVSMTLGNIYKIGHAIIQVLLPS